MKIFQGKKTKKPADGAAGAVPRQRASALLEFWMVAMGGVATVLALAFVAGLYLLQSEGDSSSVEQALSASDMLVRDLGDRVATLRQRTVELATDPLIRDALRTGDLDMLRTKEGSLVRMIPSALRVRLVAPGTGGDEDEERALSYAGLDLVQRTESEREVPPLEVHRVGQEDMHLALAAPIFDDEGGAVLGVMHVTLPVSLLPSTRELGGERVRLLLQQQVGGVPVTLDPEGGGNSPAGEPDSRVDVPGTRLQVAAWVSTTGIFEGSLPLWTLGACVLVLALLGLVLWIPLQRARSALMRDSANIVAVVEDAVAGSPIREVKCRYAETQPIAELVSKLLQDLKRARREGPSPSLVTAPGSPSAPTSTSAETGDVEENEDPVSAFFRHTDEDEDEDEAASGDLGGIEEEEPSSPSPPAARQSTSAAAPPEDDGFRSIDAELAESDSSAPAPAPAPAPVAEVAEVAEIEPLDLGEIDLDAILPLDEDDGVQQQGSDPDSELEPTAPDAGDQELAATTQRIFGAYDIRGIVGEDLTAGLSRSIGFTLGSEVIDLGESVVYVARDTRPSGAELCESLVDGLRKAGCDVTDLGIAPTPLLYFATRHEGEAAGVMVTASHNPMEYNGMKLVIGGASLVEERIGALRSRLLRGEFTTGDGSYEPRDLIDTYITAVSQEISVACSMKIVVDCGNGAASVVAADLYRTLDVDIVEINCDADAGFPDDRVPDPTKEECMSALRVRVVDEEADLGLAFDGDGDRLGVVDSDGGIIGADRVLMLLAADVLTRNPGADVVFDVKSSHHLGAEILRNGGRPIMWRSGHAPLKAKMAETGALIGGEWSGHIVFRERWNGFDDALYAGARLLEVLALDPRPSAEVFADLPASVSTPELFLPMAEAEAQQILAAVHEAAEGVEGVDLYRLDGLRLAFAEGWALVRASNTLPALVFRFEGDDEAALAKAKELLRAIMNLAAPDLDLPF